VDAEGKHVLPHKVCRQDGALVSPGDTVRSFRGEDWRFIGVERLPVPGKSAKVTVAPLDHDGTSPFGQRSYYAQVFNLTVTIENEVAA
jgi:hypothetical protein